VLWIARIARHRISEGMLRNGNDMSAIQPA
jgi:hypothetical protein